MGFKRLLNKIFGIESESVEFQRPITEIDLTEGMHCHIPCNGSRVIKEAKYNVLGGTIDILSVDEKNNEYHTSVSLHGIIDVPKERILCAAIKRINPRPETQLRNNDIHLIEIGYRHCDIFHRFRGELSHDPNDQGFYTSKGRFVGREEGYWIAKAAGQIINPHPQEGTLYSEDLY